MAQYPQKGVTMSWVVLGILALVLIMIFISIYLFGGHHEKSHPDQPQSRYVYPVSQQRFRA